MAKPRPVEMTFSVFEIKPLTVGVTGLHLPQQLFSCLNKTNTAKERLMKLSSDENSKDSDFISGFSFGQGFLFGPFVRLNAGEESIVKLASLDKKMVGINEMITEAKEGSAGTIRSSVFFCMSGNLLVISSAKNNRGPLETYINWMIRNGAEEETEQCKFVPVKNTVETIPIKNIKSIQFADSYLSGKSGTRSESLKLKRSVLKDLLNDVPGIKDLNWDDIISGTLLLKINKKQLKKKNAAALDTALRLIDSDSVIVTGTNGHRIKGTEYLVRVPRKFEQTEAGYYNEKAIETEMRTIIKAVKNGQVVA